MRFVEYLGKDLYRKRLFFRSLLVNEWKEILNKFRSRQKIDIFKEIKDFSNQHRFIEIFLESSDSIKSNYSLISNYNDSVIPCRIFLKYIGKILSVKQLNQIFFFGSKYSLYGEDLLNNIDGLKEILFGNHFNLRLFLNYYIISDCDKNIIEISDAHLDIDYIEEIIMPPLRSIFLSDQFELYIISNADILFEKNLVDYFSTLKLFSKKKTKKEKILQYLNSNLLKGLNPHRNLVESSLKLKDNHILPIISKFIIQKIEKIVKLKNEKENEDEVEIFIIFFKLFIGYDDIKLKLLEKYLKGFSSCFSRSDVHYLLLNLKNEDKRIKKKFGDSMIYYLNLNYSYIFPQYFSNLDDRVEDAKLYKILVPHYEKCFKGLGKDDSFFYQRNVGLYVSSFLNVFDFFKSDENILPFLPHYFDNVVIQCIESMNIMFEIFRMFGNSNYCISIRKSIAALFREKSEFFSIQLFNSEKKYLDQNDISQFFILLDEVDKL